jgi:thiazole tautomerase (transcriptional regulator TenI)
MDRDFPIVHAITDSAALERADFPDTARRVMSALGPRGAVHLRTTRMSGRRFHDLAAHLAQHQETCGCWLIVNDRVDIAAAVGAWGIQLASHSLSVSEARAVAVDIPVGASVHSVDEAREAQASGASWCVAGTVFETPSHPGQAPSRIPFIRDVARAVSIPVIAIGGIQPENVEELLRAGAYGVATIRGADWDRRTTSTAEMDLRKETRLPNRPRIASREPVTRYISAYDAVSERGRDDHADGERSPAGDSTR